MDIFDLLTLIGGLALFLFGMNLMGSALEKRAGGRLKGLLENVTSNTAKGLFMGLAITALMQSSSVTTVMVVGFVNSGLMTLRQSVSIIMGANLGAAITPWILSLSGVSGGSTLLQLLKPSSFTPVVALIGVILHNFTKSAKKKDTGMVLLGFAVLMYGMEIMSGSVADLRSAPSFTRTIALFSHPLVGVLVGVVVTAVIQSSSASIGILQALSATGSITYATAVPVIMGQNIGTCISAILSCLGASKNAKRAALIHLLFNVLSTLVCLPLWLLAARFVASPLLSRAVTPFSIAMVNTVYKLVSLALLVPFPRLFVRLAELLIPDAGDQDEVALLDERLLKTPSVAISRARTVCDVMAEKSVRGVAMSLEALDGYDEKRASEIIAAEDRVDYYEDKLGSYLVKLSSESLSREDGAVSSMLLRLIGDFERISDHSINILHSAEEVHDKRLQFSEAARKELAAMRAAVTEIMELSLGAYRYNDLASAAMVEPLESVIKDLGETIRANHVARIQSGECTIELGFILSDLLTNLERISAHCSNVAGCVLELTHEDMALHAYLHSVRHGGGRFDDLRQEFAEKYALQQNG